MCERAVYSDWECFPTDYEETRRRLKRVATPMILAFVDHGESRTVLNIGQTLDCCLNRLNRSASYEWTVENDELTAREEDGENRSQIFYRIFRPELTSKERLKVIEDFKSFSLTKCVLNKYTKTIGTQIAERMN